MLIYLQSIDSPQEKSKFEAIYYQDRHLMYTVAYNILNNTQDAEDSVHQAFVKIAENIQKVSEPEASRTKSYVVTIVENQAIDLYRRKQRFTPLPLEEATVGLSIEYTGDNLLTECMARLPARYRHILLLKYYHGYTTKEIARMLGLTESNASKLEQRSKAKLKELCKEVELL